MCYSYGRMAKYNKIIKLKIDGKIFEMSPYASSLYEKILKSRGPETAERLARIKFGLYSGSK
jgi:hypothetical protein